MARLPCLGLKATLRFKCSWSRMKLARHPAPYRKQWLLVSISVGRQNLEQNILLMNLSSFSHITNIEIPSRYDNFILPPGKHTAGSKKELVIEHTIF